MENKNRITVIIPFLNEGDEIEHTLESIRSTSGNEVDIILVNDASTDGYDYFSVAERFHARYIQHTERCGVARSRDEAIRQCETEIFLLLDGHMRFTRNDWSRRFIDAVQSDLRCVWCGQTKVLHKDENGQIRRSEHQLPYGAYVEFDKKNWSIQWNYTDPSPGSPAVEVPVVLGASYACNQFYWKKLGGLEGLQTYGFDEQLISTKAWLEGGSCKLLKEIEVEHLYRKAFPYQMNNYCLIYNELLLSELFLPDEMKESFFDNIIKKYTRPLVIKAMEELTAQEQWVESRKETYRQWLSVPIEQLIERHDFVKNRNKHPANNKSISRIS